MSVKIVKFHRTSKRGEMSKFDHNPRPRGAATVRTTSFKFSRSAKRGYGEGFKFSRAMNRAAAWVRCARQSVAMNFKFNHAASYKFNQTARRMAAQKQRVWRFAEIPSQRRAWQTAEILPQRYVRQNIEILSQQYARRSMRQDAEIALRQYARQTGKILQDRSLPRAAKIILLRHIHGAEIASAQTMKALLFRHTPQGEISRAENRRNFNAIQRTASRRNFIEIARMMSHQIPAENNKILADSHKIPNESRRTILAKRGSAQ